MTYSCRRPSTARLISSSFRPFAIGIRGVEKVDAELGGAADRLDRRCGIGLAVKRRHGRAAQTDRRHLQLAELATFHLAGLRGEGRQSARSISLTEAPPRGIGDSYGHVALSCGMDGEFPPLARNRCFRLQQPVERAACRWSSPRRIAGPNIPADFLAASRLDPLALRRSEDSFVDELFAAAPSLGAPLLSARFPRAYLDVNREAYELDPSDVLRRACRVSSMPDRRGSAWVSARSPGSSPAAKRSTRRSCVSPKRGGGSNASIIPITRRCAGWSKRPRPVRRLSARRLPFDAIGSRLRLRDERGRHRSRRLPRRGLRPADRRGCPPVSSASAALPSRSTRPMPAGSRPATTAARARTVTHCRSRSTGRFTWTSAAIAERRAFRTAGRRLGRSRRTAWAASRRNACQRTLTTAGVIDPPARATTSAAAITHAWEGGAVRRGR